MNNSKIVDHDASVVISAAALQTIQAARVEEALMPGLVGLEHVKHPFAGHWS